MPPASWERSGDPVSAGNGVNGILISPPPLMERGKGRVKTVSQFVIPAKPRKAGREPGSRSL